MTAAAVPQSRVYRHTACGEETVVGGQSFQVVSNPMSSMERTQCSNCGAMFPIAEFEWADTGETLGDYYARHTQNATAAQRFMCSKTFMIGLILLFVILTEIGIWLLLSDAGTAVLAVSLLGGLLIGAIIGMAVFLNVFANPITRKVCGVADTRSLR